MLNRIATLASFIFLLTSLVFAEESAPDIRAEFSLAIQGGRIGDPLPFVLRIAFSDTIRIDPSAITGMDLKPSGIQKELFDAQFVPYDAVEAAAQSPAELKGWIRFYAPGEYTIPPVAVHYTCLSCPDTQVRSVRTCPTPVKIGSIIHPGDLKKDLIIPLNAPQSDFRIEWHHQKAVHYQLRTVLFFLLAGGCLIWTFVRIYSARKQKEVEKKKLPDSRDLVKQLLLFLETAPDPLHWKFMAQAGMLLRDWLVAELGLTRSARGGTGSIFFEAIESQIPVRFRKEIQQILLMADHAAALESGTEKDDFMTRIAALVRSIRNHQDRAQAGS